MALICNAFEIVLYVGYEFGFCERMRASACLCAYLRHYMFVVMIVVRLKAKEKKNERARVYSHTTLKTQTQISVRTREKKAQIISFSILRFSILIFMITNVHWNLHFYLNTIFLSSSSLFKCGLCFFFRSLCDVCLSVVCISYGDHWRISSYRTVDHIMWITQRDNGTKNHFGYIVYTSQPSWAMISPLIKRPKLRVSFTIWLWHADYDDDDEKKNENNNKIAISPIWHNLISTIVYDDNICIKLLS